MESRVSSLLRPYLSLCIIVPEMDDKERETLEDMVKEVNSTQVLPEEVLSDSIYHYDRKKHHLTM